MRVSSLRIQSFLATHRFRPALLPTVAMVAVAALAIALGNWQRHRADEKRDAAALASAAALQAPLEIGAIDDDAGMVVYRTVHGAGEYVTARSMLIDNKVP